MIPSKYRTLAAGALGLLIAPLLLLAVGLTLTSATDLVIFSIAALGLNLLLGHTGLTSFGHGAWFGIGAYAAALSQLHWFERQFVPPLLFALVFVAVLALAMGFLILRRRGVYFALLTLALSALTFAIAFRWTALTGGESGLGGIVRPAIGPVDLDDPVVFLVVVSLIGFGVLYLFQRLLRSPFGHVIVAIRENEQRAAFQGYDTNRYKLLAFTISATITGLAGALLAFHHRFASAEPTSVIFSGELLAMVIIGGMRSLIGPALGALFYILFREYLSIFTPNWLLYFGLLFIAFILFSPNGLIGVWGRIRDRLRPPPEDAAAMSKRQIHEGLPLPDFLRPTSEAVATGAPALEVQGIAKHFGGIKAVVDASLVLKQGEIHALIGPNGAGKTTAFNLISGMFAPDRGSVR
ncbi:MAG TPA: ATP-binding cassette domain-containing protein, partial [Burkholderiaceae bacterium]|nr:ATP-binding cassette domain-containing protein [Burkholderiaceae bacterium]